MTKSPIYQLYALLLDFFKAETLDRRKRMAIVHLYQATNPEIFSFTEDDILNHWLIFHDSGETRQRYCKTHFAETAFRDLLPLADQDTDAKTLYEEILTFCNMTGHLFIELCNTAPGGFRSNEDPQKVLHMLTGAYAKLNPFTFHFVENKKKA